MEESKKIFVYSGKLNKNVELEAYDMPTNKDITIITATSLKRTFESIKSQFGITDSILSDIRTNSLGNIVYASVEWTIKDKDGYESTFIGEATPESLTSDVAKQYPKVIAYNRAQSIGIKSYLQLNSKVYTNDEIPINQDNNEDMLNIVPEITKDVNTNIDTSKPSVHATNTSSIYMKLKNTEVNNTDKSEPKAAEVLAGSISNVPSFTEEDNVELNDINNEINENSIVPIGVFSGKTIKELFETNTTMAKSFIQMCKLGQVTDTDPDKMAIIDYIAKHA